MFDINIKNVPKAAWYMIGTALLLVAIGMSFSLIFRGSAVIKATKASDKTLADDVKKIKDMKDKKSVPTGMKKQPGKTTITEFDKDGRPKFKLEQMSLSGSGSKTIRRTEDGNGIRIEKGN